MVTPTPEPEAAEEMEDNTLVVVVPDDPEGLDPLTTYTLGWEVLYNIYETLGSNDVDYEEATYLFEKFIPELAESWEVAEDRKSLTIKIRPDATWHDGSPVTADDVIYSWTRSMNAGVGFGPTQNELGGVTSVDQYVKVDDRTVRIDFPNGMTRWSIPNLGAITLITLQQDFVESLATEGDEWGTKGLARQAMGSSAYMLESYVPGESVVLKASPDYWGDIKPYYAEINYRIVPDSQTRLLLLESGDADIAYFLSPSELLRVAENPDLQVISAPAVQDTLALRMNPTVPPFDDVNIRKAIIKAIPYDRIIEDTLFGFGTRIKSPCGANTYGYKEYDLFETDAEEARRLVAESKYAGNVPEFTLTLPTRLPEREAAAVLMQDALSEVGITMNIQLLPYNAYWDKAVKREYDVNLHTMGPWFNDCLYWAYWMFKSDSPTNYIDYNNPELDQATLDSFQVALEDKAGYDALLKEVIDDTLVADALVAPLYQPNWSVAARKGINGIVYWPWLSIEYKYLREEGMPLGE